MQTRATAWSVVRLAGTEFTKEFANEAGQLTAATAILLIVGRPVLDLLLNQPGSQGQEFARLTWRRGRIPRRVVNPQRQPDVHTNRSEPQSGRRRRLYAAPRPGAHSRAIPPGALATPKGAATARLATKRTTGNMVSA
ncbi:hypothetical protein GCM10010289_84250 [Streptomyces violascens]|nr:hypothetical protein GCM10010289_84250 [Streptomyces violascens]